MSANPAEASRLFREALDALSDQRKQIEEDQRFCNPSDPDQWDPDEKRRRETDPGGARPCLVFDQLGQYVANVAGQVEQRPPAIHAIPVADDADAKVAEQIDGVMRYVEYSSRAQVHYTRALTSAARVGVGYLVVRPQYVHKVLGYQEPRISSEGDPLKVVLDPWSQEIDGSDATFGFLLSPMSYAVFERTFGRKKKKVSFGDEEQRQLDRDREEVLVAEQWRIESATRDMVAVRYANGDLGSLTVDELQKATAGGEIIEPLRGYTDKVQRVLWSVMSGAEVLQEEREYPASSIGIVPVYGYVSWADGRMSYCGIARRAMQPQRAYNYHMSEIRAFMSLAPKAPWIVPKRAVKGLERLWDKSSVESRAYLPYNDVDETGQPIAPPTRAPVAINLANHTQGAERALQDIQASIGMYQANLGAPSNETSGIAINERKQQGEASTAHFPAHLAASLTQVGRICVEMIPRMIDTRRQLRVISIDGKASTVVADPQQAKPYTDDGGKISINPSVGRYDVRVVVGGNFATQRQQAQQAYTEMMRAAPQMLPAIAPLWAQTLDVPHADKLAQVLTAMAPDPVKAILQPHQDGEDTAQLRARLAQLEQALQQATQIAQEAQADADEANAKLEAKEDEADAREEEAVIKAYDAQTKRIQALAPLRAQPDVNVVVRDTIAEMLNSPDPWPGEKPEDKGPSPELQALMQQTQALTQGQQALAQAMTDFARRASSPRRRVPVLGPDGRIKEVIEQPMDQPQGPMQ